MSDGPFRSAPLSTRWKKFGDTLAAEAASLDELVGRARDALVAELGTASDRRCVAQAYFAALSGQIDLDGLDHSETRAKASAATSQLLEAFSRQLMVSDGDDSDDSLEARANKALSAAVGDIAVINRQRIDEHLILAVQGGLLTDDQAERSRERNQRTFERLDTVEIANTLLSKSRPTWESQPKTGIDEGPEL